MDDGEADDTAGDDTLCVMAFFEGWLISSIHDLFELKMSLNLSRLISN
jgi:hypothetical protein